MRDTTGERLMLCYRDAFGMAVKVPKVIVDPMLVIRGPMFRLPRSKGRRIREKWMKDPRNYRTIPDPNFYEISRGTFVVHPAVHLALQNELNKRGYIYHSACATI